MTRTTTAQADAAIAEELITLNITLNKMLGKHTRKAYEQVVLDAKLSDEATLMALEIIEADHANQAFSGKSTYFRGSGIVARLQVAIIRLDKNADIRW